MNMSSARKFLRRSKVLAELVGLVLMAVAVLVAVPISASAGEPYFASDDAAAYQSAQYGQPIPPPPPYPGSSGSYARHKQLVSQLNYAEWHYNHARQAGNWEAANHWKK